MTLGASGYLLGTRTGASGTATLAQTFLGRSQGFNGHQNDLIYSKLRLNGHQNSLVYPRVRLNGHQNNLIYPKFHLLYIPDNQIATYFCERFR